MAIIETITQFFRPAMDIAQSPPFKVMAPPPFPPANYDRATVWREIIAQSGGAVHIATDKELSTLRELQTDFDKWGKAVGEDGETARIRLQNEWAAKVEAGQPYDVLGTLSDHELTRRHTFRQNLTTERHERICRFAKPVVVSILQRLPALAAKLVPAAEADESHDKAKCEQKGIVWVPSTWTRQLYQTGDEVKAHLERLADAREQSPSSMLCNCIAL